MGETRAEPIDPSGERSLARAVASLAGPVGLLAGAATVVYGVVRLLRPDALFYYAEGPLLWSLVALDEGGLSALYPAVWSQPPLILTLYPPTYLWLAATLQPLVGSHLGAARLVSLLALGAVAACLVVVARRRGLPWRWTALTLGVMLVVPPFFNLAGGAQVDLLGLALTAAGLLWLTSGARQGAGSGRLLLALLLFLLAFFVKQSYVAAPAAVGVALFLNGHRARAAAFLVLFAALASAGVLLLNRATGGGFSANAFGGLSAPASLVSTLRALGKSAPWAWGPLLLVVALAVRRELRPGLPEAYAALAWVLHVTATARVGGSVNYLAEPLFAALFLAVTRAPAGGGTAGGATQQPAIRRPAGPLPPSLASPFGRLAAVLLLFGGVAVTAAHLSIRILPALRSPSSFEVMGRVEGYPLTEAEVFPALRTIGARPWLNDPLAFGVLLDVGRWDPAPLVAELEARRVPFLVTFADLRIGPAPPGVGADQLLFGSLWLAPPVWRAITTCYERVGSAGRLHIWHPREAC